MLATTMLLRDCMSRRPVVIGHTAPTACQFYIIWLVAGVCITKYTRSREIRRTQCSKFLLERGKPLAMNQRLCRDYRLQSEHISPAMLDIVTSLRGAATANTNQPQNEQQDNCADEGDNQAADAEAGEAECAGQ